MDEQEQILQLDGGNPPSRRGWYLAVGGIVVAILAVGAVFSWKDGGDPKFPYDNDLEGINDLPSEPQGYGAPDDGLESIGLPVTVTPATELTDGQTVQITATGFPANGQVGLIQCTSQSITLGQGACDMSTLGYATTDADGTVSATFTVRQHLYVGDTPVDCGTGNVDPATWVSAQTAAEDQFTCILGVGSISNYDISGNSALAFEGAVFGGPAPSLPDITTTTQPEATCPTGWIPVRDPDGFVVDCDYRSPDDPTRPTSTLPLAPETPGTAAPGPDD